MTDDRKKGMEVIAERLRGELTRLLSSLQLGETSENVIFGLLGKRVKKETVRSYFVHMVFEYAKEQAKLEGIPLTSLAKRQSLSDTKFPLLAEGIITVQYLVNHILDGKNGTLKAGLLDPRQVQHALLASHQLKDHLYEYVAKEVFPTDLKRREMVRATMSKIFRLTDEGQGAEKKWATHEHFRAADFKAPVLSQEAEDFIDQQLIDSFWRKLRKAGVCKGLKQYTQFYLRRVYLTNVGLFVSLAELVCDLIGYNGKQRGNLLRFAGELGLVSQLVNDVCDFLPASYKKSTSAKLPEDAFSDLRNGNITLPFIFLASTDGEFDTEKLAGGILDADQQTKVFELVKPVCFFKVIPFLQAYANETRLLLKKKNIYCTLLGEMTDVVYNDKYFKHFKVKKEIVLPARAGKKQKLSRIPPDQ